MIFKGVITARTLDVVTHLDSVSKHIALSHSNSIGRSKMLQHIGHKMSLVIGMGRFPRPGKNGSGAIDAIRDTISAGVFTFGLPPFGLPPFEEAPPTLKLVKC